MEIIRDAAAEGRLTLEELDQRVESALGARTLRELATLTRDLPEQPRRGELAVPLKDLVKIEKRIGKVEWVGTWVVPRRMEIKLTVATPSSTSATRWSPTTGCRSTSTSASAAIYC